ncbi:ferritin heavy chain-like [Limulus polyphemus]|uniref:Ferritin n=1 Tax=Limulus polyphemus TaxID=6850 RepID=A0ABM1BNQ8_LIMPO|nr:ferritin heavy chain-like [Limulus polyphemus]
MRVAAMMERAFVFVILALASTAGVAKYDNEMKEPKTDRYSLDDRCVNAIQHQINEEMHASLIYMNMAAHFDSNSVGRKGFAKFFKHSSDEEREHAQKLIDYVNKRSGKVIAFDIKMPGKDDWKSGLEALEDAMNLEKHVNNKLHHLHHMADKICSDPHLMDFIEGEFLTEQVDSINEYKTYISQLGAMNSGMGEYLFDRQLLEKSD